MTAPPNPVPFPGPAELERPTDGREVDPSLGLLQGEFTAGDHVLVDAVEGELAFTRTPAEARAAALA